MKSRVTFMLGLMLTMVVSACATNPPKGEDSDPICAEWLMPDSAAYNVLGKHLATILFSPQSVKCYHLIGKEEVKKGDIEIEQHFVRDTLLATLKPTEIAILQYALIKPAKSYSQDSIKVMSPYMPILEFEFTKKKEKAHVVISLSDLSWTVIYDDKNQFNFNYANQELISQFCKYYISKLNSQAK